MEVEGGVSSSTEQTDQIHRLYENDTAQTAHPGQPAYSMRAGLGSSRRCPRRCNHSSWCEEDVVEGEEAGPEQAAPFTRHCPSPSGHSRTLGGGEEAAEGKGLGIVEAEPGQGCGNPSSRKPGLSVKVPLGKGKTV